MGLINSRKRPRAYGAPELVRLFKALLPGAHLIVGRDARYLSRYMEEDAQGALDVIYSMLHYRDHGASPCDIPSFIRWARRQDNFADIWQPVKEADVAEALTGKPLPREAWPYYDLAGQLVSGAEIEVYRQAQAALQEYLWAALGEP